MIEAAVDYASQFLGRPVPWVDESNTAVALPGSVRAAILLILGDLYAMREETAVGVSITKTGSVERLLHFYRVGLGV